MAIIVFNISGKCFCLSKCAYARKLAPGLGGASNGQQAGRDGRRSELEFRRCPYSRAGSVACRTRTKATTIPIPIAPAPTRPPGRLANVVVRGQNVSRPTFWKMFEHPLDCGHRAVTSLVLLLRTRLGLRLRAGASFPQPTRGAQPRSSFDTGRS